MSSFRWSFQTCGQAFQSFGSTSRTLASSTQSCGMWRCWTSVSWPSPADPSGFCAALSSWSLCVSIRTSPLPSACGTILQKRPSEPRTPLPSHFSHFSPSPSDPLLRPCCKVTKSLKPPVITVFRCYLWFWFLLLVQLSIQSPCSIPTLLPGRRAALGGSGGEGQFPCLPALFPITTPHSPPWAHSYIRWLWECWTVSLPASSLPHHHSPLSLSSLGSLYSGWLWEWWTVPLPASGIECLSLAICLHPNVWLLLFFWVVCPMFKKLYSI